MSNEEQTKIQNFVNEYNELCKKYGFQIVVQPLWIPTNHGSYEMSFKLNVDKIQQNNLT